MLHLSEEYECKADSKGRIMVPAPLRTKLAPVLQQGMVIKRSIFQPCLEIYTMEVWQKEMAKISKLNRFVKKNNDFVRQFTAGVRSVEIDATGRLSIPKILMQWAGMDKDVVLSEVIDRIEVWDKDKYNQVLEQGADGFSDLAEDVMGNLGNDLTDAVS